MGRAKLAAMLLGGTPEPEVGDVHLELYWKGMRDYIHQEGQKREDYKQDLAESYGRLFPDLRKEIENFGQHQELKSSNYEVSSETLDKFSRNLINTEIDIVLESPGHLFIGEAKHEMSFGGDSSLILVHQLIRQYVMAKLLVDRIESKKKVIPFCCWGLRGRTEADIPGQFHDPPWMDGRGKCTRMERCGRPWLVKFDRHQTGDKSFTMTGRDS